MQNKTQTKKILTIIVNVILYIFLAVCLVTLVIAVVSKKNSDGAVTIFGAQMRVVTSSSMEKCDQTNVDKYEIKDIPIKSLVFIETVPTDKEAAEEWYASLKVGDVLTFKYVYTKQETITHRIVEITEKDGGGYIITLEGDNKNSDTETLSQTIDTSQSESPNYIIGKVTAVSRVLGVVITALKSSVGLICLIIVPCTVIMIFEIVKVVNTFTGNNRKAQREEALKKDAEMAELKRRLAELEKANEKQDGDTAKPSSDENDESE